MLALPSPDYLDAFVFWAVVLIVISLMSKLSPTREVNVELSSLRREAL